MTRPRNDSPVAVMGYGQPGRLVPDHEMPPMRERLCDALVGLSTGKQHSREKCVDALLEALMTTSGSVVNAAYASLGTTDVEKRTDQVALALMAWQDMITAIREGK